jgi:hypothetical protein
MPELITTFDEALANATEFQSVGEHTHSKAFINLEHFFHWYYFPQQGIFAPSKFIGYKDANIVTFSSHGLHLHDAQEALSHWFTRLEPASPEFDEIQNKLEEFLSANGAHLHVKTRAATGGIYLPKD